MGSEMCIRDSPIGPICADNAACVSSIPVNPVSIYVGYKSIINAVQKRKLPDAVSHKRRQKEMPEMYDNSCYLEPTFTLNGIPI